MNIENSVLKGQITESVYEIFDTMIMMGVESELPHDVSELKIDANITSMIGLGGDMRGMVSVHLPEKVARQITESFLGMEVDGLDDDVKDAIGEVANMVAGGIKIFFTDKGIHAELAIPTTVIGNSFKTSGLSKAEKVIVPFRCDPGIFWVELKYMLNKKNS